MQYFFNFAHFFWHSKVMSNLVQFPRVRLTEEDILKALNEESFALYFFCIKFTRWCLQKCLNMSMGWTWELCSCKHHQSQSISSFRCMPAQPDICQFAHLKHLKIVQHVGHPLERGTAPCYFHSVEHGTQWVRDCEQPAAHPWTTRSKQKHGLPVDWGVWGR